jgi:hypothetical protein
VGTGPDLSGFPDFQGGFLAIMRFSNTQLAWSQAQIKLQWLVQLRVIGVASRADRNISVVAFSAGEEMLVRARSLAESPGIP